MDHASAAFRIRAYHANDRAAVGDVFVAGMVGNAEIPGQKQSWWDGYIAFCLQDDLATIEATYFASGGHFWVAVVDRDDGEVEEVVGIVGLEHKGNGEGEVRRLSVKHAFRRYGVARALVTELERWAMDHKYTRVTLSSGYILKAAHAFYKSIGYRIYWDEVYPEDPQFLVAHFEKRLATSG